MNKETEAGSNSLIKEDKWLSSKSILKVESGLSQEQCEELWKVLNMHLDAFAFSKGNLGYCTVCEHEIDT